MDTKASELLKDLLHKLRKSNMTGYRTHSPKAIDEFIEYEKTKYGNVRTVKIDRKGYKIDTKLQQVHTDST